MFCVFRLNSDSASLCSPGPRRVVVAQRTKEGTTEILVKMHTMYTVSNCTM